MSEKQVFENVDKKMGLFFFPPIRVEKKVTQKQRYIIRPIPIYKLQSQVILRNVPKGFRE